MRTRSRALVGAASGLMLAATPFAHVGPVRAAAVPMTANLLEEGGSRTRCDSVEAGTTLLNGGRR